MSIKKGMSAGTSMAVVTKGSCLFLSTSGMLEYEKGSGF